MTDLPKLFQPLLTLYKCTTVLLVSVYLGKRLSVNTALLTHLLTKQQVQQQRIKKLRMIHNINVFLVHITQSLMKNMEYQPWFRK